MLTKGRTITNGEEESRQDIGGEPNEEAAREPIRSEIHLRVLNDIYHQNEHNLSFFLTQINQASPPNSTLKEPTLASPELKKMAFEKRPKFKHIYSDANESPKISKISFKDPKSTGEWKKSLDANGSPFRPGALGQAKVQIVEFSRNKSESFLLEGRVGNKHFLRQSLPESRKRKKYFGKEKAKLDFPKSKKRQEQIFRGKSADSFHSSQVDQYAPSNEEYYVDLQEMKRKNFLGSENQSLSHQLSSDFKLSQANSIEVQNENYFSYGVNGNHNGFDLPRFTSTMDPQGQSSGVDNPRETEDPLDMQLEAVKKKTGMSNERVQQGQLGMSQMQNAEMLSLSNNKFFVQNAEQEMGDKMKNGDLEKNFEVLFLRDPQNMKRNGSRVRNKKGAFKTSSEKEVKSRAKLKQKNIKTRKIASHSHFFKKKNQIREIIAIDDPIPKEKSNLNKYKEGNEKYEKNIPPSNAVIETNEKSKKKEKHKVKEPQIEVSKIKIALNTNIKNLVSLYLKKIFYQKLKEIKHDIFNINIDNYISQNEKKQPENDKQILQKERKSSIQDNESTKDQIVTEHLKENDMDHRHSTKVDKGSKDHFDRREEMTTIEDAKEIVKEQKDANIEEEKIPDFNKKPGNQEYKLINQSEVLIRESNTKGDLSQSLLKQKNSQLVSDFSGGSQRLDGSDFLPNQRASGNSSRKQIQVQSTDLIKPSFYQESDKKQILSENHLDNHINKKKLNKKRRRNLKYKKQQSLTERQISKVYKLGLGKSGKRNKSMSKKAASVTKRRRKSVKKSKKSVKKKANKDLITNKTKLEHVRIRKKNPKLNRKKSGHKKSARATKKKTIENRSKSKKLDKKGTKKGKSEFTNIKSDKKSRTLQETRIETEKNTVETRTKYLFKMKTQQTEESQIQSSTWSKTKADINMKNFNTLPERNYVFNFKEDFKIINSNNFINKINFDKTRRSHNNSVKKEPEAIHTGPRSCHLKKSDWVHSTFKKDTNKSTFQKSRVAGIESANTSLLSQKQDYKYSLKSASLVDEKARTCRSTSTKKSVVTFVNAFETDNFGNLIFDDFDTANDTRKKRGQVRKEKSLPIKSSIQRSGYKPFTVNSVLFRQVKEPKKKPKKPRPRKTESKSPKILRTYKVIKTVTKKVVQTNHFRSKSNTLQRTPYFMYHLKPLVKAIPRLVESTIPKRVYLKRERSKSTKKKEISRPVSYEHVRAKVSSRRIRNHPLNKMKRKVTNFIMQNVIKVRELSESRKGVRRQSENESKHASVQEMGSDLNGSTMKKSHKQIYLKKKKKKKQKKKKFLFFNFFLKKKKKKPLKKQEKKFE